MNKKISTPIAIGIILILAIVLVIFILSQSIIITFPLIEFNKNKCTQDAVLNNREKENPCNRTCNSDGDCKEECGCGCISKEEKCIYTGVECEAPDPDYDCKCVNNACSYEYIGIDETADWQTYINEDYGFEIKYPNGWKYIDSNDRDEVGFFPPNTKKDEEIYIGNQKMLYKGEVTINVETNLPEQTFYDFLGLSMDEGEPIQIDRKDALRFKNVELLKVENEAAYVDVVVIPFLEDKDFDNLYIILTANQTHISDKYKVFDKMIGTFRRLPYLSY